MFFEMSIISSSNKITAGSVNVDVSAVYNKKFQCAVLYVEFDTKEDRLLGMLLQKYISEKVLTNGINMNNSIYNAISGSTSIVLFVPENKLTQNIVLLYSYLMKTKLTSNQCKICGKGNYKTLASDLKSFSVKITGKCKNFVASLKNDAPKIDRLKESLKAVSASDRENFDCETNSAADPYIITINCEKLKAEVVNDVMLYCSVVMGNEPCDISKSGSNVKIECFMPNAIDRVKRVTLFKDTFQGKVKSFLTQSGSVGSPAANDKGQVKFNEKVKMIMKCQNELAHIFSHLRGFNYKFDDEEQLKKVNSEAMNKVRSIK